MTEYKPNISRVDKKYDNQNKLTAVIYYYELSRDQKMLLMEVIDAWTATILPKPYNYKRLLDVIRQVIRTNSYSEDFQIDLQTIRSWYVMNLVNNKS